MSMATTTTAAAARCAERVDQRMDTRARQAEIQARLTLGIGPLTRAEQVRAWTEEGLSGPEIGRRLGVTPQAVHRLRRNAGLPPPGVEIERRRLEEVARAQGGQAVGQIAMATGVSPQTVRRDLDRAGVARRSIVRLCV